MLIPINAIKAQITPDGTLESTVQQIQELMKIDGGLREGNNLFHSFEDFNIPEGMEAAFENATDIENIFTRITGDSVSEILGTLSANGSANFFLMNPNGIVFGENASINVGGSFMATTADSIEFEDGTSFAAGNTDTDPILTTDRPTGFMFDGQPGAIQVFGGGNAITPSFSSSETQVEKNTNGLKVSTGNTLGLIGSGITIDSGSLTTEGGQIKLGSVGSGAVGLELTDSSFALDYRNINDYQNVNITNLSVLDASGIGKGEISVTGRTVGIENGSLLLAQNRGDIASGTVNINAFDTLTLSGTSDDGNVSSAVLSETLGSATGSNIDISARNVVLKDGARINASTFSNATGGNINLTSAESIQLLDNGLVNPERGSYVVSGISAVAYDAGDGGAVRLSTTDLRVTSGNSVQSSASGSGNGGNLTVDSDTIEITGTSGDPERPNPSALAASVNSSKAGNLTVDTSQLKVTDGGAISSSTYGTGIAGNVNIKSSESIEVSGENDDLNSRISASVISVSDAVKERLNLPDVPNGSGGDLNINTSFLNIAQGGEVSVGNIGEGNAGQLSIVSKQLNLDNSGGITGSSASGVGGNVDINSDNLQINNKSKITAEAENQGQGGNINISATNITAKKNSAISANADGGDGGNIDIDTATITGSGNSDITANAVEGDGGNIDLTADFIVGFEERAELTQFSDIVASSEFGQSGTININAPESDAQKDPNVNAVKPEDVKAGEFLKAVCPNPDNRYGKKTFQYIGMGVPRNPDNYRDSGYEAGYLERRHRKETLRQRVRESLRNGGDGKIDPDTLPPDPLLLKTRIDYPPLDQPQTEQHRRDIEQIKNRSAHDHPSIVSGHSPPVVEQFPFTTTPLRVIYSQSNTVPPEPSPKPGEPLPDANAVQINPDGSKHLVRVAQIQSAQEQMCANSY